MAALGRGAQLLARAALLALVLFAASASAYDAAAAAAKSDTTCSESQCQNGGAGYGCDANKRCCCTDLVIAALAAGGVTATNRGVRRLTELACPCAGRAQRSVGRAQANALADELVAAGWTSADCT